MNWIEGQKQTENMDCTKVAEANTVKNRTLNTISLLASSEPSKHLIGGQFTEQCLPRLSFSASQNGNLASSEPDFVLGAWRRMEAHGSPVPERELGKIFDKMDKTVHEIYRDLSLPGMLLDIPVNTFEKLEKASQTTAKILNKFGKSDELVESLAKLSDSSSMVKDGFKSVAKIAEPFERLAGPLGLVAGGFDTKNGIEQLINSKTTGDTIEGAIKTVGGVLELVGGAADLTGIGAPVGELLQTTGALLELGVTAWDNRKAISTEVHKVEATIANVEKKLVTSAFEIGKSVEKNAIDTAKELSNSISSAEKNIANTVSSATKSIETTVTNIEKAATNTIVDVGKDIANTVGSWFE